MIDQEVVDAIVDELAPVIVDHVAESLAPLIKRLARVESRPPVKGDPGPAGKDADPAALEALRAENLELRGMVAELLAKPALPGPQGDPGPPGKDANRPSAEEIHHAVDVHLKLHPPAKGEPGKDAPPVEVTQIAESVAAYIKANPPKDGDSIKGDPGPAGRGIAEALIDADGGLVVTFTDGAVKSVGRVKGIDGKNADPIKGDPGKDGADALGVKDFEVLHDGGRVFTLRWANEDRVEERTFTVPAILDCGVWTEKEYEKGDAVSFGGSIFIAQSKTKTKPETGPEWRLAVKRGRDGNDVREPRPKQSPAPLRLR